MTEKEITSKGALRDCILRSGYNDDFVSMADVQSCIFGGLLADMSTERQQLVVDTIRSLLEDGLIEVGVPSQNSPGFKAWPGTIDEVMTQFVDRFVGCYDDPLQWRYKIWLNLTAKGQQVLNALVGDTPEG